MSVTFSLEQGDDVLFTITCSCGITETGARFFSYQYAENALSTTTVVCEDEYCRAWPVRISLMEDERFMLNLSNVNAIHVLEALGIVNEDDQLVGALPAEDFLGRVLVAQAVAPVDAGVPAFTQGQVVYCGRPEGYLQTQLESLRVIAEEAVARGSQVVWA